MLDKFFFVDLSRVVIDICPIGKDVVVQNVIGYLSREATKMDKAVFFEFVERDGFSEFAEKDFFLRFV